MYLIFKKGNKTVYKPFSQIGEIIAKTIKDDNSDVYQPRVEICDKNNELFATVTTKGCDTVDEAMSKAKSVVATMLSNFKYIDISDNDNIILH